jgi:hypothetical protein
MLLYLILSQIKTIRTPTPFFSEADLRSVLLTIPVPVPSLDFEINLFTFLCSVDVHPNIITVNYQLGAQFLYFI